MTVNPNQVYLAAGSTTLQDAVYLSDLGSEGALIVFNGFSDPEPQMDSAGSKPTRARQSRQREPMLTRTVTLKLLISGADRQAVGRIKQRIRDKLTQAGQALGAIREADPTVLWVKRAQEDDWSFYDVISGTLVPDVSQPNTPNREWSTLTLECQPYVRAASYLVVDGRTWPASDHTNIGRVFLPNIPGSVSALPQLRIKSTGTPVSRWRIGVHSLFHLSPTEYVPVVPFLPATGATSHGSTDTVAGSYSHKVIPSGSDWTDVATATGGVTDKTAGLFDIWARVRNATNEIGTVEDLVGLPVSAGGSLGFDDVLVEVTGIDGSAVESFPTDVTVSFPDQFLFRDSFELHGLTKWPVHGTQLGTIVDETVAGSNRAHVVVSGSIDPPPPPTPVVATYLTEDFESGLGAWSIFNANGTVVASTSSPLAGSKSLLVTASSNGPSTTGFIIATVTTPAPIAGHIIELDVTIKVASITVAAGDIVALVGLGTEYSGGVPTVALVNDAGTYKLLVSSGAGAITSASGTGFTTGTTHTVTLTYDTTGVHPVATLVVDGTTTTTVTDTHTTHSGGYFLTYEQAWFGGWDTHAPTTPGDTALTARYDTVTITTTTYPPIPPFTPMPIRTYLQHPTTTPGSSMAGQVALRVHTKSITNPNILRMFWLGPGNGDTALCAVVYKDAGYYLQTGNGTTATYTLLTTQFSNDTVYVVELQYNATTTPPSATCLIDYTVDTTANDLTTPAGQQLANERIGIGVWQDTVLGTVTMDLAFDLTFFTVAATSGALIGVVGPEANRIDLTWTPDGSAVDHRVYFKRIGVDTVLKYFVTGSALGTYSLTTVSGATTGDPPVPPVDTTPTQLRLRIGLAGEVAQTIATAPRYTNPALAGQWVWLYLTTVALPPVPTSWTLGNPGWQVTLQGKPGGDNDLAVDACSLWLLPHGESQITVQVPNLDLVGNYELIVETRPDGTLLGYLRDQATGRAVGTMIPLGTLTLEPGNAMLLIMPDVAGGISNLRDVTYQVEVQVTPRYLSAVGTVHRNG